MVSQGLTDEEMFGASTPQGLTDEEMFGPSVGRDILKTIPSAAARAYTGISGAAGDLDSMARSSAGWLLNQMGATDAAKSLGQAPSLPTSQGEQKAIEGVTGPLYQPQTIPGKIVGKTIEYAPAAVGGPGSLSGKALMTAGPAAAGVLAGEGAKAAGMPEYADAAETATGLLTPLGIQAAARPFALKAARAGLLNTSEIKAARDALYQKSRDVGVTIKPDSYRKFAAHLTDTVRKAEYDLELGSKATGGLLTKIVDTTQSVEPMTLDRLHTISERAGGLIDSTDPTTRGLGKLMYKEIQKFKRGLSPKDVNAPKGMTPQMAVQMERDADALHGRYKKSQQLDVIYRKSKNRGANYTVAGEATGIRQKFRALADKFANPDSPEARYFSKEEQDAIEKVARGGKVQNAVRNLSKMSLNNIAGIGIAPMAAGIGMTMGGPLGAVVGGMAPTVASMPFKLAERAWTKANANRVSDLIRGGKKLKPKDLEYPGILPALGLLGLQE